MLMAQSVLLAAAGERTPVIIDAVALILLLRHSGQRPRHAHLHGAVALTVLGAVLAITGLRAEQGRSVFYSDSGLGARVGRPRLGGGPRGRPRRRGGKPWAFSRRPPTGWTARRSPGGSCRPSMPGSPRSAAAGVPQSLLLAVPSAAWPSKLGTTPD